jgi:butyrate kinase
MSYKILSINPGSTSTKIAVYEDENPVFVKSIDHPHAELEAFDDILSQFAYRKEHVLGALAEEGIAPGELDAVVGRGGMLPPVKGGGYLVGQEMLDELHSGKL